jgi:hypothetical protein
MNDRYLSFMGGTPETGVRAITHRVRSSTAGPYTLSERAV